ncbi:MAG: SpoIIE family protein phosphatase [Cyclobacteriaceae bacterium]|nr:SpoIIE family protein phosphatase [Cyclobacteriaceae bacterium]
MVILAKPVDEIGFFHFAGMRAKAIIRLIFLLTNVTWIALLLSALAVMFSQHAGIPSDIPEWLPRVLLGIFLAGAYLYYKFKLERDELLSFIDLLWRVFATGIVATLVSLILKILEFLPGSSRLTSHFLYQETAYLIIMPLWAGLMMISFTACKRFILYQKTKWSYRFWMIFEYGLLGLWILSALPISLTDRFDKVLLGIFVVLALVLSANTRWVAYLNIRQKLTALTLLFFIIFFHGFLFYTSNTIVNGLYHPETGVVDHREHLLLLTVFLFIIVYSVFSFLVLIFNLPTSSAFEQKLEEVMNFRRISQSIQTEQSEESVYRILLETSVSTVNADAAWLEMKTNNPGVNIYTYGIKEEEARQLSSRLHNKEVKGIFDQSADKTHNLSRYLKGSKFRSVIAAPVKVKDEHAGTLVLLKELADGFNREMKQIAATFANQAGISIENFRLMEEAFQNERYKEELKIARRVQKSLLPRQLEQDTCFEAAAFSESADEVGGDYYDTLRLTDEKVAVIIADVSGKGTTAAFHMSQMKGVFHSLADSSISPEYFMRRANRALAYCLDRGSFISAAYFIIHTRNRMVYYARAGHCPVLYYRAADRKATYLNDEGAALGMVRHAGYDQLIKQNEFSFEPGDLLILYTDGITEARNSAGEEFGFDRLSEQINQLYHLPADAIVQSVIENLYAFTGTKNINDDYTLLVIRFR